MLLSENEIVMLLICTGIFVFIISNRQNLRRIICWRIFVSSFYFFFAGAILTNIEEFVYPELFNFLEHAAYAISSCLLALWAWQAFTARQEEAE